MIFNLPRVLNEHIWWLKNNQIGSSGYRYITASLYALFKYVNSRNKSLDLLFALSVVTAQPKSLEKFLNDYFDEKSRSIKINQVGEAVQVTIPYNLKYTENQILQYVSIVVREGAEVKSKILPKN